MENLKRFLLEGGANVVLSWIFRLILVGVFLWLKSEFVTKDKYLDDQSHQIQQWTQLTGTLTHVSDVLDQLSKHEDDQETRIRQLEREKK